MVEFVGVEMLGKYKNKPGRFYFATDRLIFRKDSTLASEDPDHDDFIFRYEDLARIGTVPGLLGNNVELFYTLKDSKASVQPYKSVTLVVETQEAFYQALVKASRYLKYEQNRTPNDFDYSELVQYLDVGFGNGYLVKKESDWSNYNPIEIFFAKRLQNFKK